MAAFDLVTPRSADEAVAALRAMPAGEAAVLAGGTDLMIDLDEGRTAPRRLVSLRHLPWRTVAWGPSSVAIGSTLSLRELERDPALARRLPGLYEAVRAVGGPALRARATLGGNLGRAAPVSDLIPILLALDAEVDLIGPDGERSVPVDRFIHASRATDLRRAELIRTIRIPELRPCAYAWQRVRPVNDISQVSVAVARSPGDGRWHVAIGGVAPRSVRVPEVEAAIRATTPAALAGPADRLARHPALVGDKRASDEYRRRLVATLFVRAVARVAEGSGP